MTVLDSGLLFLGHPVHNGLHRMV